MSQADMIELLPCPFCGGEARVLKDGLPYVVIECERCFCRTNCNVTEAEAIAAWNSRAELGSGNVDTDDALALLDEIREADRISYDDYSQLFDAIAVLNSRTELGSEREKALEELKKRMQELGERMNECKDD